MGNNTSSNEDVHDYDNFDEDLTILIPTLELIIAQLDQSDDILVNLLADLQYKQKLEERKRKRTPETRREKRKTFSEITSKLTEQHFRRMFRLPRASFYNLCTKIENNIGDQLFKSERKVRPTKQTQEATNFRGGEISGELRIAIYLRMMAGASYLDIFMIYDVHNGRIYNSFEKVVGWMNDTFSYPFVKALRNEDHRFFEELSEAFSGDSGGVYTGCIGAIDGLALRIKRPSVTKELPNPGGYYCRKGFFALNVQSMCDRRKRILWMSSRHIGSCHDSRAFLDTGLYELLVEKKDFLKKHGFFIAGDSAYNMESFLLIPYDDAKSGSVEDAYNFWQSNSRIRIECTFGELIMRFGIFWRTLRFDIKQAGDIVNAAGLLHNFILEERELADDDTPDSDKTLFQSFSQTTMNYLDEPQADRNLISSPTEPAIAIVSDNNEPSSGGRPTTAALQSKQEGALLRDILKLHLEIHNKKRPKQKNFKYNDYGMVYM